MIRQALQRLHLKQLQPIVIKHFLGYLMVLVSQFRLLHLPTHLMHQRVVIVVMAVAAVLHLLPQVHLHLQLLQIKILSLNILLLMLTLLFQILVLWCL